MSVSKQITIWCDSCAEWEEVPANTIREAERTVLATGWVRRKGGKHQCSNCVKEKKIICQD